jgi:hypothetical protein
MENAVIKLRTARKEDNDEWMEVWACVLCTSTSVVVALLFPCNRKRPVPGLAL